MLVWYQGNAYFVGDPIPEHVPLPIAYSRILGCLSYSNYYNQRYGR